MSERDGKVALKINCAYFTFTSDGRGVQPNQANQSLHLKCLVIFVIPFCRHWSLLVNREVTWVHLFNAVPWMNKQDSFGEEGRVTGESTVDLFNGMCTSGFFFEPLLTVNYWLGHFLWHFLSFLSSSTSEVISFFIAIYSTSFEESQEGEGKEVRKIVETVRLAGSYKIPVGGCDQNGKQALCVKLAG